MTNLKKNSLMIVSLVIAGQFAPLPANALCFWVNVVQCATINDSTCTVVVEPCHSTRTAVASANAYYYPARLKAEGDPGGVDAVVGASQCAYPAVVLDCNNNPLDVVCPATTPYSTVDWSNGNAC